LTDGKIKEKHYEEKLHSAFLFSAIKTDIYDKIIHIIIIFLCYFIWRDDILRHYKKLAAALFISFFTTLVFSGTTVFFQWKEVEPCFYTQQADCVYVDIQALCSRFDYKTELSQDQIVRIYNNHTDILISFYNCSYTVMESPAVFFNKYDFIIKNGTVFMNAELICSILNLTFISKNDCVYINRSLKKIQGIHVFFQKNLIRIIYDLNGQPEFDFYKISNDTYLVKFYNTEYPDIFFYKEYDARMKYIKTVHYSDKEVWSRICTFTEPQVKKSIQDNKVTIDFEFAPREKKVVVIDPGHGGEDPGAIGPGGTYEKDINLRVALKTVELLKNYEIDTIMTRTIDIYTELEKRSAIAEQNDADLFISIHMNSFPQNRQLRGSEIYYYDFTAQNYSNRLLKRENLDEDFQSILLPIIQSKENTIRDSRYYSILLNSWALLKGVCSRGIFPQDFWVLAYAQCPAVLFELDYLSNPEVENCFLDGAYQDTYAEIIAKSIIQYFGLKK